MFCDWYAATIPDSYQNVIGFISNNIGGNYKQMSKGVNGYDCRAVFDDENGNPNATILWGGNNGANPHAFASSDKAIDFRNLVREVWPEHSVTRIDVAEDFKEQGFFDECTARLLELAKKNRVKVSTVGDWLTDKSLDGRTLYVGSPTSSAYIRLYEKGKQIAHQAFTKNGLGIPDGMDLLDVVRLELQIRPKKSHKALAAKSSLEEMWGYSPWTQEVADELLNLSVPRVDLTEWKKSDDEQALKWLAKQYGGTLNRLADRYGSRQAVFDELWKAIDELDEDRRKRGLKC